jgi:hypothetical protein
MGLMGTMTVLAASQDRPMRLVIALFAVGTILAWWRFGLSLTERLSRDPNIAITIYISVIAVIGVLWVGGLSWLKNTSDSI